MQEDANRKPTQGWLSLNCESDLGVYDLATETPTQNMETMERIVAPSNVRKAYQRVKRNGGCPGTDGMTVEGLCEYLREHWQQVQRELLEGSYKPSPVKRHDLPKPGGGTRTLGIPTVLDRLIQQAVLQVLQPEWDPTFSEDSYGFRPGRSAHQAVDKAREHYRAEHHRVVDLDLEKFFDRVNHDKLMSLVRERVADRRVRRLIRRYLQAEMMTGDVYSLRGEGTPQGGPLSPLLANLMLDQLDRELERRGHRFVRYADDVSIYVRSERAGRRVLESITRFLQKKLKLSVNESKSTVAKPRARSLLGFSIGKAGRVFVSDKSIRRLKERIRKLTARTRGRRIEQIVREVAEYLQGWQQYFNYAYNKQGFRELTAWIKRRLRCYIWRQWGRAGYRELRKLGVSRDLAWNTCKSHHGSWRLSRSPALAFALTTRYFVAKGLPLLHVNV